MVTLYINFDKSVAESEFPDQFFKKISCVIDVLRQSACLVVNPIKLITIWLVGTRLFVSFSDHRSPTGSLLS